MCVDVYIWKKKFCLTKNFKTCFEKAKKPINDYKITKIIHVWSLIRSTENIHT